MNNYGFDTHYMNSAYSISGSGTNDGHGGRAEEHKEMMESIANEIFEKRIHIYLERLETDIYAKAYSQIMENLSFDIETAVSLAFDDAHEILLDSKTRKVIATHVMDEIKKQMRGRLI